MSGVSEQVLAPQGYWGRPGERLRLLKAGEGPRRSCGKRWKGLCPKLESWF